MPRDEVAGGRPTWEERNGLGTAVAPPPRSLPRTGDDLPDPPPAPAPRDIEKYRKAILKLAEGGGDTLPAATILEAAQRTPADAKVDLETARKRITALATIDAAQADFARADELAATPPPRGAQLDSLKHVADLLVAIERFRQDVAAYQAAPPGQSLRSEADRRIRQAELTLVETADSDIDREIDAIRTAAEPFRRRITHWQPLLQEAAELEQLRASVRRWGGGQLAAQERVTIPRDALSEGVIPGARQRREQQQRDADQRRVAELLARGRERLQVLEARRVLHAQARRETDVAERELADGEEQIRKLQASKRRPEVMRWAV